MQTFKQKFSATYHGMKQRCNNPKTSNYNRYGLRGITYKWPTFSDFKKDMYDSFLKHIDQHGMRNTTLERVNNDKSYSKANCKWATYLEQENNRSHCVIYKGKNITQWAKQLGVSRITINSRLRHGWGFEKALNTPVQPYNSSVRKLKKSLNTLKK